MSPAPGYSLWELIQVHVYFSEEQISSSTGFCPCHGDVSCQRPLEFANIPQGCVLPGKGSCPQGLSLLPGAGKP